MRSLNQSDLSRQCPFCKGQMNYSSARKSFVCDNCGFKDKSF